MFSQQIFDSHLKMSKFFAKKFKKLFLVCKVSKKIFVTSKTIHEVQILSGLMAKLEKKILNDMYWLGVPLKSKLRNEMVNNHNEETLHHLDHCIERERDLVLNCY